MFFAFVKRVRISSPGITFFAYTIEGVSTRVHHRDRYFKIALYKKFRKKVFKFFKFGLHVETNRIVGNNKFLRNILQILPIENVVKLVNP